uniref:Uncharacterized protein TCIL3000_4_3760 n=1 Tax=Trypanosoma congolense (strain IL3000) TaxID=1068625 RepID=G0ULL7_TRYCI|nr:unnamed protein product [Trypanosoma congolense IL3000]
MHKWIRGEISFMRIYVERHAQDCELQHRSVTQLFCVSFFSFFFPSPDPLRNPLFFPLLSLLKFDCFLLNRCCLPPSSFSQHGRHVSEWVGGARHEAMSGFLLPVRRLAHLFSSFDVSRVRCMYLARPAFSAPFPSFVLFSFSFCLLPSKCIFFFPSPLVCLSLCPTTFPFTYRRILHVCLWGSAGRVETETTERCMFFFFPFPFFFPF